MKPVHSRTTQTRLASTGSTGASPTLSPGGCWARVRWKRTTGSRGGAQRSWEEVEAHPEHEAELGAAGERLAWRNSSPEEMAAGGEESRTSSAPGVLRLDWIRG